MAEEARQRDNPHYKRKTLNLFGFLHYRNGCGSVGKKKSKEKADTSVNLNPFLNCKAVTHIIPVPLAWKQRGCLLASNRFWGRTSPELV